MLTPIANIHRSKLPPPGAIVRLPGLANIGFEGRWIVTAFPLSNSPDQRYASGIHMVHLAKLGRPDVTARVSGFWCDED